MRARILAIDDSASFRHGLVSALRDHGYDVLEGQSGEDALTILTAQPVDCVLLDRSMPCIGGEETCRRIRQMPDIRDVPVIMLTSSDDRQAMIAGLAAGADDYVGKSEDVDVLHARLAAQLRRKQCEDDNRRMREELLQHEVELVEARAGHALAATRAALVAELEQKNRELAAFSYSVSHDLRAPLRSIDGFTQALQENYAAVLDDAGRRDLQRVRAAARRMNALIDDLLLLSRAEQSNICKQRVDITSLAHHIVAALRQGAPDRAMTVTIEDQLTAHADPGLIRIVLENLFGNAWKFTAHTEKPVITLKRDRQFAYTIQDNGAGFDMAYAGRLFTPFQRLHRETEFPGTGIGLATVQRIVSRHGGRVWADSRKGQGAAFSWTLNADHPLPN